MSSELDRVVRSARAQQEQREPYAARMINRKGEFSLIGGQGFSTEQEAREAASKALVSMRAKHIGAQYDAVEVFSGNPGSGETVIYRETV